MSIFYRSFTELFKLKIKNTHLWFICQLIGSFALTFFNYIHDKSLQNASFTATWLTNFLYLTFLFIGIYYCITCITHEKVNRNQTWRLIPMSSSGLYADNMLSSFVSVAFFCILEIISNIIFLLITMLVDRQFAKEVIKSFQYANADVSKIDFQIVSSILSLVFILILLGFLFYFIVDFLNFSSRSIADFLPGSNGQAYIRVIIILLIILIAWTIINTNNFIASIVLYPLSFLRGDLFSDNHTLSNIIILLITFNVVLAIINLFSYNKFFEASESK